MQFDARMRLRVCFAAQIKFQQYHGSMTTQKQYPAADSVTVFYNSVCTP